MPEAPAPPTVRTSRLLLRLFQESDLPDVGFYTKPSVMRYIPRGAWTADELAEKFSRMLVVTRERWRQYGYGMWAIVLGTPGQVIGHCGLQNLPDADDVELFYLLDEPNWNKGLASEAARAVLRFGFERTGLQRIVAIAMPENVASLRVMEKAGMRRVGEATHYGLHCIKYVATRDAGEGEEVRS